MTKTILDRTCLVVCCLMVGLYLFLASPTLSRNQVSVYLPIVQRPPVLVLSKIVPNATTQYTSGVMGEVINLSETQAFSVTLEATIYDPNEQITDTIRFSPELSATLPQQSNPFGLYFSNPRPTVRSLTILEATELRTSDIRSLTVVPATIECRMGYYGSITGIVRNDTPETVAGIFVHAWDLENHGGLVGNYINTPLAPGEEVVFSTSWSPFCGQFSPYVTIDMFHFAAQGTVSHNQSR